MLIWKNLQDRVPNETAENFSVSVYACLREMLDFNKNTLKACTRNLVEGCLSVEGLISWSIISCNLYFYYYVPILPLLMKTSLLVGLIMYVSVSLHCQNV